MLHRLIIYIAGCGCNLNSGYDGSVKQRLIGIQWSWIRIPLQHTFYSYFQTTFSGGKLYIFVRSLTTSNLAKLSTLLRAPWWHQFFSPRWPEPYWWVLGRTKHVPMCIYIKIYRIISLLVSVCLSVTHTYTYTYTHIHICI